MGAKRAIIIAGTQSGSGKTTVTLAVMAALAGLGHKVQPFKCGPDFIDPSLHKLVTGTISRNLDIWMSGEPFTCQTFARHAEKADISVIEGVMGMFDGGESSSAALAAKLGVPLLLVLDVGAAAESAAAVLKGFETLNPQVAPRAVILNQVASPRHLELVSDAIRKHCRAEILGYLPRTINFRIPERHLGLHMGAETPLGQEAIAELAATVTRHVDLARLMAIATVEAKQPRQKNQGQQQQPEERVQRGSALVVQKKRIGVALDQAFCFYYEDNLDLLKSAGAELVFFSPLADEGLPADIQAIYLGGGYPELYAPKLSANKKMLSAMKKWAEDDRPIYAECGGFMYLTEGIVDHDEQLHPMAGIFPVWAKMRKTRTSLGYREIRLRDDSLLGPKGTVLRGHEFHYSTIAEMPAAIPRLYAVGNGTEEGYRYKNVLGGYIHLHFGYNPQVAAEFLRNAL
ncbi:MAG: cobyrinate a,c-diamide synthase [Thermodesulfobacteriota bacterium]